MGNKTIALIPSAGRGSRMMALTDDMPKSMLPLHSKPLIAWHLDKLLEEGIDEVCLVVGYKKEKLIEYVDRFYSDKMTIYYTEQNELRGLAEAVQLGILEIATHNETVDDKNLLVILGDTIVKDDLSTMIEEDQSFIGYHNVEDYKRWCLIQDKKRIVTRFIDKPDYDPKTRKAVIGVYFFNNIKLLLQSINEIMVQNLRIKNEFQLSSAMELYMEQQNIEAKEFLEWFDCGDIESFSKTRKNIARHFNTITITEDSTIIKKSSDEKKLQKEIVWYLNLPNKLRVYTPQLIDYNGNANETFYELEYVNFSPIHELFLYTMPDLPDWEKLFKNIFNMVERFKLYSSKAMFNTNNHLRDILLSKTKDRINQLLIGNRGDYWRHVIMDQQSIKINGKTYKNYPLLKKDIEKYVENNIIPESKQYWQIIHGDLFFGNMLYDINSDTLKVIDPRGNFGVDGIYGDIRYDIAKLNHSVVGKYDFIVNGLYAITHQFNNEFEYIMYDSDAKHRPLELLFKEIVENSGFNYDEITVITGLLFLSMIPLHEENFDNQKMFYMQAIQILNSVL